MADEQLTGQDSTSKRDNYFGSSRAFYTGSTVGSTAAWTFINFSGTNTGFGTANNLLANRFLIAGSNTSFIQWSWNSGVALAGELGPTTIKEVYQDGINASGVWIRSNVATQIIQIWAW